MATVKSKAIEWLSFTARRTSACETARTTAVTLAELQHIRVAIKAPVIPSPSAGDLGRLCSKA